MSLNPKQFPTFPGMEPPPRKTLKDKLGDTPVSGVHRFSSALYNVESDATRRVLKETHASQKPPGFRGSIGERLELSHRRDRQHQNEDRWETLRGRIRTEDAVDDPDYDYNPEAHPRTGLPTEGLVDTEELGMTHVPGQVPHEISYGGSAASARRQVGERKWIPVPGIRTVQDAVSAERVHQILDDPSTTQTPRFHKMPGMDEMPHVHENMRGQHTLIDGNHRTAAHLLDGRLFMEARVLTDRDIPTVKSRSKQIDLAKKNAEHNPRRNARQVEEREERNFYGTGY